MKSKEFLSRPTVVHGWFPSAGIPHDNPSKQCPLATSAGFTAIMAWPRSSASSAKCIAPVCIQGIYMAHNAR